MHCYLYHRAFLLPLSQEISTRSPSTMYYCPKARMRKMRPTTLGYCCWTAKNIDIRLHLDNVSWAFKFIHGYLNFQSDRVQKIELLTTSTSRRWYLRVPRCVTLWMRTRQQLDACPMVMHQCSSFLLLLTASNSMTRKQLLTLSSNNGEWWSVLFSGHFFHVILFFNVLLLVQVTWLH